MPAAGRFFITPHAVRRYAQRVRPGASYNEALTDMVRLSDEARYVKTKTGSRGDVIEVWRTPKPLRLRLYVAPSRGRGLKSAVITVLWKER
jgi:hypothetical protein